jgi:hypothetical protein
VRAQRSKDSDGGSVFPPRRGESERETEARVRAGEQLRGALEGPVA